MTTHDDWGDLGMIVPDNPCYRDPEPVKGTRIDSKTIYCKGCYKLIPDNGGQGLKPSCPNCWAAVELEPPGDRECPRTTELYRRAGCQIG